MIKPTLVTRSFQHFNTRRGFSLLELLSVVAIICLLMTVAVPSIAGFTSPAGRKGAVIVVMNALEQARAAAIESGRDVAVLFWKKNGVSGTDANEPDALMLLRNNEAGSGWEPLTRWIKLPQGVLFHSEDADSLMQTSQPDSTLLSAVAGAKPLATQAGMVQFSSSGAVKTPSSPMARGLYISFTEGQRTSNSNTLSVKKQKSGGLEVISLARYTGRATMDIVSLQ